MGEAGCPYQTTQPNRSTNVTILVVIIIITTAKEEVRHSILSRKGWIGGEVEQAQWISMVSYFNV